MGVRLPEAVGTKFAFSDQNIAQYHCLQESIQMVILQKLELATLNIILLRLRA